MILFVGLREKDRLEIHSDCQFHALCLTRKEKSDQREDFAVL